MRKEDNVNLLPTKIQPPQRNLGAFTAVEEEQVPFPPQQHRGEMPARKRHHPPGTENKCFQVHAEAREASARHAGGRFLFLWLLDLKRNPPLPNGDADFAPRRTLPLENLHRKRVFEFSLYDPAQRSRAELHVVALLHEILFGPLFHVETSRSVLDMYINYEIVIRETTEPGVVFEGEGFRVRAFALRHTKPCFGYVLEEDSRPGVFHPDAARSLGVPEGPLWSALQNGDEVTASDGSVVKPEDVLGEPRRGRRFSYVTDTAYFDDIAPHVAGSDLLICEGMFTRELEPSAREKRHLTAEQAARIARGAGGVEKLGLIHYSPRYTERDLKKLLAEAREIFPNAFLTRDRQVINMPFAE